METNESEKKIYKAKSENNDAPAKLPSEPGKRNSFNLNEAVRSLDLALVRLKKSKLVNGECTASAPPACPRRRGPMDMFVDVSPSTFSQRIDNASLMSMNFSHYELARNISSSNCNSDGAFSCGTCNSTISPVDNNLKDEHLERFFRSAELWSQKYRDGGPSHFNLNRTPN
ncbi:DNA primase [Operophtera brumata]|uniref:DNA primase n=1 Tax=Operophtera brumata TaxID=104452 RepID=A0A0L7L3W2_OPEBR|nr:DNA primase [Operophtera brumata]